ncbi:MAG: YfcE family phosphodiesterase [Gammaproteobacteria bacterium]|nr:YfcE family phosphodiesterase [Gammaproteobacteria bacterium]
MKIAVISDSHDNRIKFKHAATLAKQRQAEAILHCGDIVAPSTLKEALETGLPIHAIHGNNTGDLVMMHKVASRPENAISFYGQDAAIKLNGRNIFIVHYPHYAKAMALTGEYDLVCYGHDHHYHEEHITNINGEQTLLANPGSVAGLDGPASFMLIDLQDMSVEKVLLD